MVSPTKFRTFEHGFLVWVANFLFVSGWKPPLVICTRTQGKELTHGCTNTKGHFQPDKIGFGYLWIRFMHVQVASYVLRISKKRLTVDCFPKKWPTKERKQNGLKNVVRTGSECSTTFPMFVFAKTFSNFASWKCNGCFAAKPIFQFW